MKVLIIGNRSHQFIYNYVKTLKKVYLNSDLEIDILSQDSSDLFFPSDKFYNNLKSASNLNGNLNCSKELEHYAS